MAEEGGELGVGRWVLRRPAPGKMEIQLVVDEETKLSSEVKGAIEQLISALQPGDDVQGYRMRPDPSPPNRSIGGLGGRR